MKKLTTIVLRKRVVFSTTLPIVSLMIRLAKSSATALGLRRRLQSEGGLVRFFSEALAIVRIDLSVGSTIRGLVIGAVSATALTFSAGAFAQQSEFATAQEARTMLDKAVSAVKTDKAKALDMFNKGEGGFKDRDLYPFCFNIGDGIFVAAIKQLHGTDVRALKDPTGKVYGPELYAAAQKPEGQITEVGYMFTRPGADKTPVPKVTFVTRVGDIGCAVGYYK